MPVDAILCVYKRDVVRGLICVCCVHVVLASGDIKGLPGVRMLALAAKLHAVPIIVVTGLYKLFPWSHKSQFLHEVVDVGSPEEVIPGSYRIRMPNVSAIHPLSDYVPAEHIGLIVTEEGEYHPQQVSSLALVRKIVVLRMEESLGRSNR